jgi:5-methylcytosine-specific restriction endonuclease McrA
MEYLGDEIKVDEVPEDKRPGDHERFMDADSHGEWSRGEGWEPCQCRLLVFEKVDGVHYAEYKCKRCGTNYDYVQKPENEGERSETSKFNKSKIARKKGYNGPFCFICLRADESLHKSEAIIRDHIIPLDQGGKDEIGNLRLLCSTCHNKFKPWVRIMTGIKPKNAY